MNYFDRISYEPETGVFRWAVSARGITAGKIAGSVTSYGYQQIKLGRRAYRAHRLAWFLTHGVWPDGEIDHIDGDPLNNRLSNLRVVDRAGNSQNRRALGATWNCQHRRWQSKIQANKIRHHLGYFDTPEEARAAYLKAKKRLHISGGQN